MIENNHIPKRKITKKHVACAAAVILLPAVIISFAATERATDGRSISMSVEAVKETIATTTTLAEASPISQTQTDVTADYSIETPWTEWEINLLAQTLAGECYADEVDDKRKVCEVILNRVSDDLFDGDTIYEVVSCTRFGVQFRGYWEQCRPITDNDRAVAEQAISDWYANDCEPLSEYRYFNAGDNHKNIFW